MARVGRQQSTDAMYSVRIQILKCTEDSHTPDLNDPDHNLYSFRLASRLVSRLS